MPHHLISFGYLHLGDAAPPAADLLVDVRQRLADPASYHAVLDLLEQGPVDGRDPRGREVVLGQLKMAGLLEELTAALTSGTRTLAIGWGQGHDRSVAWSNCSPSGCGTQGAW